MAKGVHMIPPFRNPHLDPRRWAPQGEWTPEGPKEAAERMPAFARDFFARLLVEFPFLEGEAIFLRWSLQPDDVYAFFDRQEGSFGVQIDPHLGYIIIIAEPGSGEHGDWGVNDRAQDAIDHIRSLLRPAS
jgi:hypothetical protein